MKKPRINEQILTIVFWASALVIVGMLIAIIGYITARGLSTVNPSFVLEVPSRAGKAGGISTTIVGTLYLTLGSLLLAVPIGVGTAIYLEEYARKSSRFAYLVNLTSETLAGIPSIVFGLFGFVFFVLFFKLGWSILSGSLTLSLMILPTIARTAQEALLAVPRDYRENSLALGATKWQTVSRILMPAAMPGIITGIILSIGRAVGETAALILTAGSSLGMPHSITDPARTMSVHLYMLAMEGISMERAFGTAFLVVVLIVIINFLANIAMRRLAQLNR